MLSVILSEMTASEHAECDSARNDGIRVALTFEKLRIATHNMDKIA